MTTATATITHEDMAKRVASRFLRAEDQGQGQAPGQPPMAPPPGEQQGQQEQQALPSSSSAKAAVKAQLDKVNAAFEHGDEDAFHSALDDLIKNSKHGI